MIQLDGAGTLIQYEITAGQAPIHETTGDELNFGQGGAFDSGDV